MRKRGQRRLCLWMLMFDVSSRGTNVKHSGDEAGYQGVRTKEKQELAQR